jgi:hypothetical protein
MRKLISVILLLAAILVFASCNGTVSGNAYPTYNPVTVPEEIYPDDPLYPTPTAMTEPPYAGLETSARESDIIVLGEAVSATSEPLGDGEYITRTVVRVVEAVKGGIEPGVEFTVIEDGGQEGMVNSGTPAMTVGERYAVFADDGGGGNYYCTEGNRFIERDSTIVRQLPEGSAAIDGAPMATGEFIELVRSYVLN